MKGNIAQLMQQAQKMQENLQKAQAEMADIEVTGKAGGGLVEVTLNGQHAVRRVRIDPDIDEDISMLEDLIAAAFNDAVNRIQQQNQEKMSSLAGGLPLPPGFKFP